jgi:ribosome assembly protein SQT1
MASDDEGEAFLQEEDLIDELIDVDDEPPLDEDVEDIHGPTTIEDDEENEDQIENDDIGEDNSVQAFFQHTDAVYSASFNPADQNIVVTGGGDDRAFLWKLSDADVMFELLGHTDTVTATGFNFDGKLVATASMDGSVKVWRVDNGELVSTLDGPSDGIDWLRWHPKGNVLVAGSSDGTSWLWKASGEYLQVFSGHSASVTCGSFSLDGKSLLTGSSDGTARVWDPKTGSTRFLFSGHGYHEGELTSLSTYIKDEDVFITSATDKMCKIGSIRTGKVVATLLGHTAAVEDVSFSPTIPYAASGGLDNKVFVWDLQTSQPRETLSHKDGIVRVKWHPTEPWVITASLDRTLGVWDSRNGERVKTFSGHSDILLDMVVSSDGQTIISCSDDRSARVYDLRR